VAAVGYLRQVRPDIILDSLPGKARLSRSAVLATLAAFAIIIGAGLSLLASDLPDGLEWSYAERPDQPGFEPLVANDDSRIAAVDDFQSKYSPMPDYSVRTAKLGETPQSETDLAAGWTSFVGVFGSGITMAFIWLTARILRKRRSAVV
jgi:cobalt/nickel transport system permease protein